MSQDLILHEKDFFDYVFCPSNLSDSKLNYITDNVSNFRDKLEYYQSMRIFMEEEDVSVNLTKIKDAIFLNNA